MKINPMIVYRKEFDGNALLFNPDNGDTFGLNKTASFIWELLNEGSSRDEIINAIREKMTEFPDNMEDDVDEFIAALKGKGYLAD